jgi:hypothetical protein
MNSKMMVITICAVLMNKVQPMEQQTSESDSESEFDLEEDARELISKWPYTSHPTEQVIKLINNACENNVDKRLF